MQGFSFNIHEGAVLHFMIHNGDEKNKLLLSETDVNACTENGYIGLHVAVQYVKAKAV
ncbi:hypothetical protein [Wolbachia pipientis]|uniref:hypothetical protein n=1 Tax=Wolbachia pipientis TaxID=955 RepID=UPI001C993654|nr:hypothetical protein [Wolbachia pipientis]